MKKHRRFLAMGLVCISLLLSGCGTSLYELTADEEALIIKYAAHFVAKHNIYQKDGMSIEVAEDETEIDDSQTPGDTEEPDQGEVNKDPSIGEAMNLPKGISLVHKESYIADNITIPGYSVGAGDGFTFYVLKFQMKNDTDAAIDVDVFSKNISFKLTSGKTVLASKNDPIVSLTSYVGTVKAGESVEVYLLFKVKAADASKISDPVIELVEGKTTKPVKL
jgi:hypothetical protein